MWSSTYQGATIWVADGFDPAVELCDRALKELDMKQFVARDLARDKYLTELIREAAAAADLVDYTPSNVDDVGRMLMDELGKDVVSDLSVSSKTRLFAVDLGGCAGYGTTTDGSYATTVVSVLAVTEMGLAVAQFGFESISEVTFAASDLMRFPFPEETAHDIAKYCGQDIAAKITTNMFVEGPGFTVTEIVPGYGEKLISIGYFTSSEFSVKEDDVNGIVSCGGNEYRVSKPFARSVQRWKASRN